MLAPQADAEAERLGGPCADAQIGFISLGGFRGARVEIHDGTWNLAPGAFCIAMV